MKKSIESFSKVAAMHKIAEPFLLGMYTNPGKEANPYYNYTVGGMLNDIGIRSKVTKDVQKNMNNVKIFLVPNLLHQPLKTIKVPAFNRRGEKVVLNFDEPKITLLYFYANIPDLNQITQIVERMIFSHPEWKKGIKFLALNIDDGLDYFQEYLAAGHETPFEHYFLNMGTWNEIYKAHNLEDYPLAILLNEEHIIEAIGHPLLINLEDRIMSLVCKEPVALPTKEVYSFDKVATYKAFSALEGQCRAYSNRVVFQKLTVSYTGWEFCNIATGKFFVIDPSLEIAVSWPEVAKPAIDDFKNKVNGIFKNGIFIRWNETIYPNILSKFADTCDKCKAKLGEVDQWRCVECYPAYTLCSGCAKFTKYPPTSYEDTGHCHVLYRITSHSGPMFNIPLPHFRTRKEKEIPAYIGRDWSCNICGAVITFRWKCSLCHNYDVCEKCFDILNNPTDPKFKEKNAKAIKDGHLHDVHIYVRSPFREGIEY